MTQKQQIDLLNSIMPEIIETRDPERVMLKCASEHNLAPAQLEKLAQVYNTAKTLVGLEKQANRGDSFSIVDVPNLVANYVTYSPEQKVTGKSRSVHRKVDRLMKEASDLDGWGACVSQQLSKAASADGEQGEHRLPNLAGIMQEAINNNAGGWNYVDADTQSEFIEVDPGAAHYDVLHKSASVGRNARETKLYHEVTDQLRLAQEQYEQVAYETGEAILEKCAELRQKFTPDEGRWAEAVEDIFDAYGEKSIPAIRQVEAHFDATHLHIGPYDLTKRAFVRPLVQDRHDVFQAIEEIMTLQELHKQAAAVASDNSVDSTTTGELTEEELEEFASKLADDANKQSKSVTQSSAPDGDPNPDMDTDTDRPSSVPAGDADPNIEDSQTVDAPPEFIDQKDIIEHAPKGDSGKVKLSDSDVAIEPLSVSIPTEAAASLSSLLDGMSSPYFHVKADTDAPMKMMEKFVQKLAPHKHVRQQAIDTAMETAKIDAAKQRLMLSDPVIREADPSTVNDIFETIASISPSFAGDPMRMAPVLKEALQYDSVPVHILKELISQEEQVVKTDKLHEELKHLKYDL